ncbi:NUDIX domain-containing protein [Dietzia sp. 179-F 9C3 NHS]|uniref:NUDIX domain-containing protein n=1 Tax=Dietzia sp. 179-F 9C3 NHS TaxID=3374295 RepID=UPI0038790C89
MDQRDSPAGRVISVSAVVLTRPDGAVVTVRKRGTDRFMLPGGKWEAGESPAECAARELGEELGLDVDAAELDHVGRFHTATANEPGFVLVSEVFSVDLVAGRDEPAPRAEIAELRWVRPEDVAGLPEEDCAPWAPLLVRVAREARG